MNPIFKIIEPGLFSTIVIVVGMVVVVAGLYVETQSAFLQSIKNAGAYFVRVKQQRTRLAETRAIAQAEANAEVKTLVAAAKAENGEDATVVPITSVSTTRPIVPVKVVRAALGCFVLTFGALLLAWMASLPMRDSNYMGPNSPQKASDTKPQQNDWKKGLTNDEIVKEAEKRGDWKTWESTPTEADKAYSRQLERKLKGGR